ncbi:MAG: division/cell wall cluster transcriptional repressor MraZ [Ruminococcaceae bacterium]|nr:division/cell wall cluster transcriptional repressor MraZ [Oscillospiraceae bacterium]
MRGRYSHNIDTKGRMIVPAKMREVLGDTFVVAAVMEPCVSLYTLDGWNAMLEKLEELPMTKSRPLLRYLSSNAADVTVDAQGRILIPKHLLEYAQLTKEALVIGAGAGRAEIWNPALYDEMVGSMTDASVMEDFAALGL